MAKKKPKYGNAFLDALESASESERKSFEKKAGKDEVIVVVRDGMVAMKKWRPKK